LLKELEAAAREKIDETIRIEDNGFNGIIHLSRHDLDMTRRARAVYTLNGKKITTDHEVSEWKFSDMRAMRETLIKELRDKMANDIASHVLQGAFNASPDAQRTFFSKD
jgi:hypothetical protein